MPDKKYHGAIVEVLDHVKSLMAKPLGPLAPKLYEGRQIQDLLTLGHVPVAAVAEGWTKVQEHLVNVT
jgi:hypothetical protein